MQADFRPLERAVKIWMDDLRTSIVKPTLTKGFNGHWTLQLVDVDLVDTAQGLLMYGTSHGLDRAVEWTTERLASWDNCRRMAWDMWDFKHRKDAEKFITLFHLSWYQ